MDDTIREMRGQLDAIAAELEDLQHQTGERRRRPAATRRRAGVAGVFVGTAVTLSLSVFAESPERSPFTPREQASLAQEIAGLKQEVDNLKKAAGGRVKAPFEVVSATGKVIFRVIAAGEPTGGGVVVTGGGEGGDRHGLYVLNQSGIRVVGIGQAPEGYGSVIVRNEANQGIFTVAMGEPKGTGVVVTGGTGGAGQGLYILNQSGARVAAIGQAAAGYGAVLVRDQQGTTRGSISGLGEFLVTDQAGKARAILTAIDGRGRFAVNNSNGVTVANLTAEKGGGGLLELTDPAGNRQVVAGVYPNGNGTACAINTKTGAACLGITVPGIALGR